MKHIVAGESNINEADGWSTFLKCWLLARGPVHNPQNKIILSNLEAACIIGLQHSALKLAIFSGLSSSFSVLTLVSLLRVVLHQISAAVLSVPSLK